MNQVLLPLNAVAISYSKEQLFIHQIHMFILCDWRRNIVTVIGSWYISAKSESSIYFRISFNGIVWIEAFFCYVLSNFDQLIINS